MQHEIELAYVGIEVPEPSSLNTFFSDVIGLIPGADAPDGALAWRNDAKAQRIIVQPGPSNDVAFVGFEVVDTTSFDAVVARLGAAGHAVVDGDSTDAATRRVERLARVAAPWGVTVELVLDLATAPTPFSSPLVPGGFLTEGVGFGHVVFATTAFDATHEFLVDDLGLGQSDWLQLELGPGFELEVHFYHCNERHHTVAIAKTPFQLPQRLHHIMFETNDREDVGRAFDRAWESGLPIPNGLGRHDNDEMFSFYVTSPAGFQVEVGHGARVITDNWDDNRRYDRISAWGHQPLRG